MQAADTITIRPITPADAAAFRELRLEALRTCPMGFTADLAAAEQQPAEHWQERAAAADGQGSQVVMLADDAGRLVGMTGVYTESAPKVAHIGHVWGVYVRESHRGAGVGERLMRAAIDWSRRRGLLVMKLGVTVGNESAIRCYERCGFATYATDPAAFRWDGKLYDEHLMALRL
jgi:RimJ/RimL family protein N-acetyltransferase